MRQRPLIQKRLLRRALRRHANSATDMQRQMIRIALVDETIFATVYEEAMNNAMDHANRTNDFSVSVTEDGSKVVDNLLKLLTWFLDNGPELVRMIELIIGLFGGAAIASEACQIKQSDL